jgi:DNA uptake protein ComE-like DNA-binding protein
VLFLVVIVVLMLSLSGMTYVSLLYTEHKAVHLNGDELQAEHLVGSGEEMLKVFLAMPYAQQQELGGCSDNPDRFRGVRVFGDDRSPMRGRFSILSPKTEGQEVTDIRFGLQNESARLNLGVLPEWERTHPDAGRQALMHLPGMTEAVADAILDWTDADADVRPQGAEEDYYVGVQAPYAPRNATPTSLEELLLVHGVTRLMLFGADKNGNYLVERNEAEKAQSGSQPSIGRVPGDKNLPWASLLTVASAERNLTPEGKPRVYLNERDLTKLYQQLSAVGPEPWARFIIAYRQLGRAEAKPEATPLETEIPLDLNQPGKIRIRSVLDLVGVNVRIPREGKEEPLVIPSPLANEPVSLRDTLPKLLDYTTIIRGPVIRGRVNVDLAPQAVLRAIPGMDDGLITRIVAARQAQSAQQDPGRRHALWLLTDGLVDLAQMRALLPYVTGGGDVYRAQIVGFFDQPAPTARVEVVIDATVTPPRQVYWKNLRDLGPGYPLDLLGAELPADTSSANVWQRDK